MKRLLIMAALLAGCAGAPPAKTESSERLLLQPPQDWQRTYQFNNDKTRISEFIPPDQSADDWETRLTLESHAEIKDTDPIDILMAEIERLKENCSFIRHFNLFSGFENGYPTSVRIAFCGNNRPIDKGEFSVMKAIQGNDYLYLLRLNRRVPPFENTSPDIEQVEVGVWSNYLSRARLCDTGLPGHPCTEPE